MPTIKPKERDGRAGLNTSAGEYTSEPVLIECGGVRLDTGVIRRRPGCVRVASITHSGTTIDADGVNDRVDLTLTDTRIFPLGTKFTLETLFQVDDLSLDSFILGKSSASSVGVTIKVTSAGVLTATVTDSGATTATLTISGITTGFTYPVVITRDGATVTMKISPASSNSGTIGAATTVALGSPALYTDNGANWFNGRIGFFRGFKVVKPNMMDALSRLVNPRQPSCLFDFVMQPSAAGLIYDRGPYELHAATSGSPATTSSLVENNPAPVQMIAASAAADGTRKGHLVAGGVSYPWTV